MKNADQRHPRERVDAVVIEKIKEGKSDYNVVELARLRIRYHNFPGARQIQQDLDRILQEWGLTEEELFALSRDIHSQGNIYRRTRDGEEQQDWS
ncbi:MAG: DUF3288 family protein [Cyanobacteria bacterium P01_E01_bin.42]